MPTVFFFSFIFISWRLVILQYCSGFCHTLTWIGRGSTCALIPIPPTPGLPPHPVLILFGVSSFCLEVLPSVLKYHGHTRSVRSDKKAEVSHVSTTDVLIPWSTRKQWWDFPQGCDPGALGGDEDERLLIYIDAFSKHQFQLQIWVLTTLPTISDSC